MITYRDYELEVSTNTTGKFDLYRRIVATKKDSGEKYNTRTLIGYAYSLPSAIEAMAFTEMGRGKDDKELKQYIKEFKEFLNKTKAEILS